MFRKFDHPSAHSQHLQHRNGNPKEQINPGPPHQHNSTDSKKYPQRYQIHPPPHKLPEPVIHKFSQHIDPHSRNPSIQTVTPPGHQILKSIQSQPQQLQIYANSIVLEKYDQSARLSLLNMGDNLPGKSALEMLEE